MSVVFVRLSDPSHVLPWPGQPGRFLTPAGEWVDLAESFWVNCLADGSLVEDPHMTPEASRTAAGDAPAGSELPAGPADSAA